MANDLLATQKRLERSIQELNKTAKMLPHELGYPRHVLKKLLYTFLKGVAYGLGAIVAVAIIIPLFIAFLRSANWVPMIGDFISDIAIQMEQAQKTGQ